MHIPRYSTLNVAADSEVTTRGARLQGERGREWGSQRHHSITQDTRRPAHPESFRRNPRTVHDNTASKEVSVAGMLAIYDLSITLKYTAMCCNMQWS